MQHKHRGNQGTKPSIIYHIVSTKVFQQVSSPKPIKATFATELTQQEKKNSLNSARQTAHPFAKWISTEVVKREPFSDEAIHTEYQAILVSKANTYRQHNT